MKQMIIASTSTINGSGYLDYILPTLKHFFNGIQEVLFIPYARPGGIDYDLYTQKTQNAFSKLGIKINGIHEFEDPVQAVERADGIFTGGGNTFVLVNELNRRSLFPVLKKVIGNGTLYFGTSAGSNIAGLNMRTTNDMPIVRPKSYKTLELIPFNINPHYLDPDPESKHKGETRETRIREFHTYNDIPVIGLREGSWLEITGHDIILKGKLTARLFSKTREPIEMLPEFNFRQSLEA